MNVAILGAQGLIGRAVVRLLQKRGDTVSPFDRENCNLEINEHAEQVLQNVEAVVHLAGRRASVASQESQGFELLSENLAVDLAVFRAARKAKIQKLVYASTVSVYSPDFERDFDSDAQGFQEDMATRFPAHSVRFSAFGKLTSERMIEAVEAGGGPRWSVVRLVNVYGPHDNFDYDALVIPSLIKRVLGSRLHPPENPLVLQGATNERDFLYVDDAARGIIAALDGPPGTYNLGTGTGVQISAVARAILNASGALYKVDYADGGTTGASRKVVDPSKANRVLGWSPEIQLQEGIRRTVDWYRARRMAAKS